MSEAINVTIEAALRTGTGKSYTRKLRKSGKIPAVMLEKGKATNLELDPKLLSNYPESLLPFLQSHGLNQLHVSFSHLA